MGPCAPRRPPSGKMLTHAQVLGYIYIMVHFQLRSSINAGLTERSLYNRFCIERSPKMGILGAGAKIFGRNPLGIQWRPIYVVWWKRCGRMRHYNTISWSCPFVYCCDQWFVYEWCLVFVSSWIFYDIVLNTLSILLLLIFFVFYKVV